MAFSIDARGSLSRARKKLSAHFLSVFFFGKGIPLIRQINDKEIVPSAAEDNYQKPKHAEMPLKLLPTSLKIVQILFMSYTHVYKTLIL